RAARCLGGADLPLERGRVGHVGDGAARRRTGCDRRAQRRFAAADHGHGGAGAGERRGDRAPDAAAATGDEGMLARERHGLTLSLKFLEFKLVMWMLYA